MNYTAKVIVPLQTITVIVNKRPHIVTTPKFIGPWPTTARLADPVKTAGFTVALDGTNRGCRFEIVLARQVP